MLVESPAKEAVESQGFRGMNVTENADELGGCTLNLSLRSPQCVWSYN